MRPSHRWPSASTALTTTSGVSAEYGCGAFIASIVRGHVRFPALHHDAFHLPPPLPHRPDPARVRDRCPARAARHDQRRHRNAQPVGRERAPGGQWRGRHAVHAGTGATGLVARAHGAAVPDHSAPDPARHLPAEPRPAQADARRFLGAARRQRRTRQGHRQHARHGRPDLGRGRLGIARNASRARCASSPRWRAMPGSSRNWPARRPTAN